MEFLKGLIAGLTGRKQPRWEPLVELNTIDRVSIAIPTSTPEQEAAWAKSREATALQKAGDTRGAVQALEEAQQLSGQPAQPHDEIRRAKYLQKDGRGDEAWAILSRLLDVGGEWNDTTVLDAMRLHLRREGHADIAVHYGVAMWLAKVSLYRTMKADAQAALALPSLAYEPTGDADLDTLLKSSHVETAKRQRDNHSFSIELADKWLNELTDPQELSTYLGKLLKKARRDDLPVALHEVLGAIARREAPRDYLRSALAK